MLSVFSRWQPIQNLACQCDIRIVNLSLWQVLKARQFCSRYEMIIYCCKSSSVLLWEQWWTSFSQLLVTKSVKKRHFFEKSKVNGIKVNCRFLNGQKISFLVNGNQESSLKNLPSAWFFSQIVIKAQLFSFRNNDEPLFLNYLWQGKL